MLRTALICLSLVSCAFANDPLPKLKRTSTTSSLDGNEQPILYWAPETAKTAPTTLFVFLHSWSSDYTQDNSKWQAEAVKRGWIYLHPNFRGVNRSLNACGSKLARQDIVDAVRHAKKMFNVDQSRVYLAGVSGGGHMTMLMAGHHPEEFSAASAWVGISDLPEWYHFHVKDGEPQRYAKMILQCFGGAPGESEEIDRQYRDRSPLFHMHKVGNLPLDIFAGVNDGHTGSVPVRHSLRAFNRIADSHGNELVTDAEMEQLWTDRRLVSPRSSDRKNDDLLGREIMLRRNSNASRVTIFDGGHESLPAAACDWLAQHSRQTSRADATRSR